MLAITLMSMFFLTVASVAACAPGREAEEPGNLPHPRSGTATDARMGSSAKDGLVSGSSATYRHHSAAYWAWRFRVRTRQLQAARIQARKVWRPTVDYALRLASAVSGVSYSDMRTVSYCESRHFPLAENGRYKGLFQLGWSPFGFSPFDPVANALSAAFTVVHDGSWRQWECKP